MAVTPKRCEDSQYGKIKKPVREFNTIGSCVRGGIANGLTVAQGGSDW